MPPSIARPQRWFFGPWPDLLFGCGLLYVWLFAMQSVAGPEMRRFAPFELAPFLSILFGMPHYGATLLRVYARREDRRRYALFGLWATAAMAALFVTGLHVVWVGSLLVTFYFTWSPWHYTGQNYGIALLFLRRRAVPVAPAAKRLLHASFVLSYALVFLALQGSEPGTLAAPGNYVGTVYEYLTLGIPVVWRDAIATVVVAAYAASTASAGALLLRAAPARDLAPAALVVAVQSLWFLVPTAAVVWGRLAWIEPLDPTWRAYAFLWVSVGHFLQYLWITTYYTAAGESAGLRARYLAKSLVVGAAVWTLPPLLFAPGLLGRLPFDMGLALLTASVVNLHHFVLDGAIWKLRDGRVASLLLRQPHEPGPRPEAAAGRRRRGLALGWGVGLASLLVALASAGEGFAGNRAFDRADFQRARLALARLVWLGQDSPKIRVSLAEHAQRFETLEAAREQIDRSLALWPTVEAWVALGRWYEEAGKPDEARRAYEQALALAPDDPGLRTRLGREGFSAGGYEPRGGGSPP